MSMQEGVTLIVCEGGRREPEILKSMLSCFSSIHSKGKVLRIDFISSHESSIYDFYDKVREIEGVVTEDGSWEKEIDGLNLIQQILQNKSDDKLSSDEKQILELERVTEIYLFFDLDVQNANFDYVHNLDKVRTLLNFFDDETSTGKLYISYPMVEALWDVAKKNVCNQRCIVPCKSRNSYWNDVKQARNSELSSVEDYSLSVWQFFCAHAMRKANCLINGKYEECGYQKIFRTDYPFNQMALFEKECLLIDQKKRIYVLSGLPLFLVEYFGENRWDEWKVPQGFNLDSVEKCGCKL